LKTLNKNDVTDNAGGALSVSAPPQIPPFPTLCGCTGPNCGCTGPNCGCTGPNCGGPTPIKCIKEHLSLNNSNVIHSEVDCHTQKCWVFKAKAEGTVNSTADPNGAMPLNVD